MIAIQIIEQQLNVLCRTLYNIKKFIKCDNKLYTVEHITLINNVVIKFLNETFNLISNYKFYKDNITICENHCLTFINYLFNNISLTDNPEDIIIDNKYNTCIILDCDETLLDGNQKTIYLRPYINTLFNVINNNNCYVLLWSAGILIHIMRCAASIYINNHKITINGIIYRGKWLNYNVKNINLIPSLKRYIKYKTILQIDDTYDMIMHDNNIIVPKYNYSENNELELKNKFLENLSALIEIFINTNKIQSKIHSLFINNKYINNITYNFIYDTSYLTTFDLVESGSINDDNISL